MAVTPKGIDDKNVAAWYQIQLLARRDGLPSKLREAQIKMGLSDQSIMDLTSVEEENISDFFELLIKILSNPVGRMLIYRTLIEIYRPTSGLGKDIHSIEQKYIALNHGNSLNDEVLIKRNASRFIKVVFNSKTNFFFDANTCRIGMSARTQKATSPVRPPKIDINVLDNIPDQIDIRKYTIDREIAFFHELLHWFHFLLIPHIVNSTTNSSAPCLDEPKSLSNFFYKDCLEQSKTDSQSDLELRSRINISTIPWLGSILSDWKTELTSETNFPFNQEEFLTICGSPDTWEFFIPGLELSENLYRISINVPLRFGHDSHAYVESGSVIQKLLDNTIRWYGRLRDLVKNEPLECLIASCFAPKQSKIVLVGLGHSKRRVDFNR